ncbi:MAG: shikimate kinase [Nitrospinota bacterium]
MGNIVFIGFKGAGKTSVGKVVAKKLGKQFFDTDALLEKKFFEREGVRRSFREIYTKMGASFFRQLESEAALEILKKRDSVISVGGGTLFINEQVKGLVKKEKVVYLHVDPEKLFLRITSRGVPPFLDSKNPKKVLRNCSVKERSFIKSLLILQLTMEPPLLKRLENAL